MITFVDFAKISNEKCVVILKQRAFLVNATKKFHEERIKWEERKNNMLQLEK